MTLKCPSRPHTRVLRRGPSACCQREVLEQGPRDVVWRRLNSPLLALKEGTEAMECGQHLADGRVRGLSTPELWGQPGLPGRLMLDL